MKKIILTTIIIFFGITCYASDYIFYRGNSTSQYDIAYTIKDNKLYRGNTISFSNNNIYTIEHNKIYKGNSTYYSDFIYYNR